MITITVTNTSYIKFTITANGDIRIKVNSDVDESEYPRYVEIGKHIASRLEPRNKTMRGKMRPEDTSITMSNDSKKEHQTITLVKERK